MRRLGVFAVVVLFCAVVTSCNGSRVLSEADGQQAVHSEAAPSAESATSEPVSDLALDTEGELDGMTYKYSSTWSETSDPMTNAVMRTYEISLGDGQSAVLKVASVDDDTTSQAVQNLAVQSDADRDAVIASMMAAQAGTLEDSKVERALHAPSGTRAMWSFAGTVPNSGGEQVHGYTYVGASQLYEISVTTNNAGEYAAVEPAWNTIINQLSFRDIPPVATAAQTAAAAPPAPTQRAVSAKETNEWYTGYWSGRDWDDDLLSLEIHFETMAGDFTSYSIYGTWEGDSGDFSFYGKGEVQDGYVSYGGSITDAEGNSYPMSGTLTRSGNDSIVCTVVQSGRNVGTVTLWRS